MARQTWSPWHKAKGVFRGRPKYVPPVAERDYNDGRHPEGPAGVEMDTNMEDRLGSPAGVAQSSGIGDRPGGPAGVSRGYSEEDLRGKRPLMGDTDPGMSRDPAANNNVTRR